MNNMIDTAPLQTLQLQGAATQGYALNPAFSKKGFDMAKAEEAAKDFEAMFVSEMIKPMFDGLKTDGMFGGGPAEEIFRSLMIDEYGKMIAATGQLGIADMVKEEMIKLQSEMSGEYPHAATAQQTGANGLAQNVHGILMEPFHENATGE